MLHATVRSHRASDRSLAEGLTFRFACYWSQACSVSLQIRTLGLVEYVSFCDRGAATTASKSENG
jgi:hypothetical protein